MASLAIAIGLIVCIVGFLVAFRRDRSFAFVGPDGSRLLLRVSRNWVRTPVKSAPICFEDKRHGAILQITPFPALRPDPTPDKVKELVEAARDNHLKTSVEQQIPLQRFTRGLADGYYFSCTDRNPKPGGYRYLTFGILLVHSRMFSMSVLTHLAPPGGVTEGMNILATLAMIPTPTPVATKQLPKRHIDAPLLQFPSPGPDSEGSRSTGSASPSRVESVRAGFIFTFYWQIYRSNKFPRQPSPAEEASWEGPLRRLFSNPKFSLEQVVAVYQIGSGSNEVLQRGLDGHPDYVFRWFRIGQVLCSLMESAQHAPKQDFELAKVVARGNLSAGGVSVVDCDALLSIANEMRETAMGQESSEQMLSTVSQFQSLYVRAAAKQDSFAEFEKSARKHGGVFISYSRQDSAVAREISQQLDASGVSAWLDEREIIGGTNVRTSLSDAIESSCVFVVLLSTSSVRSEWVKFEIEQAQKGVAQGTHAIVPVILDGLNATELPDALKNVVAIDLSTGISANYSSLQRSVSEHLVALEQRRVREGQLHKSTRDSA